MTELRNQKAYMLVQITVMYLEFELIVAGSGDAPDAKESYLQKNIQRVQRLLFLCSRIHKGNIMAQLGSTHFLKD